MYLFSYEQHVTQGQFLIRIELVWIQFSFSCEIDGFMPSPIASTRRETKTVCLGFELRSPVPFLPLITVTYLLFITEACIPNQLLRTHSTLLLSIYTMLPNIGYSESRWTLTSNFLIGEQRNDIFENYSERHPYYQEIHHGICEFADFVDLFRLFNTVLQKKKQLHFEGTFFDRSIKRKANYLFDVVKFDSWKYSESTQCKNNCQWFTNLID